MVFCHELGGDRWGAGGYAGELRNSGFDIFTFDFRNHGLSDSLPGYQPMPWLTEYEMADVQAAVDYVAPAAMPIRRASACSASAAAAMRPCASRPSIIACGLS